MNHPHRESHSGIAVREPGSITQLGQSAGLGEANRGHQVMAAIVADDLTGACDASVHFAVRGTKTVVNIEANTKPVDDAAVIAWNTNTRCVSPAAAAQITSRAIGGARELRPRMLLQKIDSLLRGNVAEEIAAALPAAGSPIAVLVPAFPAVGRVVKDGWIEGKGCDTGIEIRSRLNGLPCSILRREAIADLAGHVDQAVRGGIRVLVIDSADEQDLLRLAHLHGELPGVLWVGSGGLAWALAAQAPGARYPQRVPERRGPALICVGSDHPCTVAQVEQLSRDRVLSRAPASREGYACSLDQLQRGRDVLLDFSRVAMDGAPDPELASIATSSGCGALILTGGDTALFVLRSLGADAIEMRSEVAPGVPWGEIRGGVADGLPVITKSGGFGDASALIACLDFLNCGSFAGKQEK